MYVHYAITESMYGYRDNEEQWKNDYYTDEFRYLYMHNNIIF